MAPAAREWKSGRFSNVTHCDNNTVMSNFQLALQSLATAVNSQKIVGPGMNFAVLYELLQGPGTAMLQGSCEGTTANFS